MFTGLIEEVGTIESVSRHGRMFDITIGASYILDGIKIGDSIAVSGPCLTVIALDDSSFTVQAVEETLRRTTLEKMKKGTPVNLERSLRLGDRLGGHLVQGHVDGTGKIVARKGTPGNVVLGIAPETDPSRYIVEKGSIAVDGISLTVAYAKKSEFGVSVIPHTLEMTTLKQARVGDTVNLETDVIAKYVEKLLGKADGLTMDRLRDMGF